MLLFLCADRYTLEFLMLMLRHITINMLASYASIFVGGENDV